MNIRHVTAAHADDIASRAYVTARQLGADPLAARRAFDSAYAETMRGER